MSYVLPSFLTKLYWERDQMIGLPNAQLGSSDHIVPGPANLHFKHCTDQGRRLTTDVTNVYISGEETFANPTTDQVRLFRHSFGRQKFGAVLLCYGKLSVREVQHF